MPDDSPKTWKERAIEFAFSQGPAVLILIVVSCFFGFYIYEEMPKRDIAWIKALSDQTAEFRKILEDRDVRNLAYRTKADDKHADEVKLLLADSEKQYKRLSDMMIALQKHGVVIEKKLDAAMQ